METDRYKTRQTLLQRASSDQEGKAWDEFVGYYKQFIFILLRHMHVPEQECDDIVQKVLMKLWKNLSSFDADKAKFRTWLITIIRNTSATHMSQLTRQNDRFQQLESFEGIFSDEKSGEFEALYQKEWENYITSQAMKNIKECFSGKAIEVFRLSLTDCSPQEIADSLGIHLHSVYNLKNRVKARLIEEVKRLRSELEE